MRWGDWVGYLKEMLFNFPISEMDRLLESDVVQLSDFCDDPEFPVIQWIGMIKLKCVKFLVHCKFFSSKLLFVKFLLFHGSFVAGADLKLTACNQISFTLIIGIIHISYIGFAYTNLMYHTYNIIPFYCSLSLRLELLFHRSTYQKILNWRETLYQNEHQMFYLTRSTKGKLMNRKIYKSIYYKTFVITFLIC